LDAAHLWGFERVLVLIDTTPSANTNPVELFTPLAPLWAHLDEWSNQRLFLKHFLPTEWQNLLATSLQAHAHLPLLQAHLQWDAESLQRMLAQRFRAAGSRYDGLNALASSMFHDRLDEWMLNSSAGSPRKMLQLTSSLINIRANAERHDPTFNLEDWHTLQKGLIAHP
jgi:hypothetical protein